MQPTDFVQLFGPMSPLLILAVVMGVTQAVKEITGLEGKWAKAFAIGLGALLGALYTVLTATTVSPLVWFTGIIYGFLLGLTAAGLYKLGKPRPSDT